LIAYSRLQESLSFDLAGTHYGIIHSELKESGIKVPAKDGFFNILRKKHPGKQINTMMHIDR
jgi:hypothetical protein